MTDGCPIPFSARVLSPPEVAFDSWTWVFVPATVNIDVVFDNVMNQSVTPPDGKWSFYVDGLARAVDDQDWQDAYTLRLRLAMGAPPAVDVEGVWLSPDPGLISLYSKQVPPFGPFIVPPA